MVESNQEQLQKIQFLGSGKTYTIPIFLYRLDLGSAIHPEHIEIFHKNSHDALLQYWQQNGCNMEIGDLMDYDPYLNRISNPSGQNN